jgi:DNA-binding transcriptional ArsR family regulator
MAMAPRSSPHRQGTAADWPSALAVFDALSRQGRMAVFRCVVRSGEEGVDTPALLRELRTTGSALTLHLRCLADAGLIHARGGRVGRFVADLDQLRAAVAVVEAELGGAPEAADGEVA